MALFFRRKSLRDKQADEIALALDRLASGDLTQSFRGDSKLAARLAPSIQALQVQLLRQRAETAALAAGLTEMRKRHDAGAIDAIIDPQSLAEPYRDIATGINDLVKSHIDVKMNVVRVVSAYANGDFSVNMPTLPGKKRQVSDAIDNAKIIFEAVNKQAGESEQFIGALAEMSKQHQLGWIDEKISVDAFSGGYKSAAELVNTLVRAHIDVKMKIVNLVTKYAQGDFSEAMDRLPGKKAMITEAMDQAKSTFESVAAEAAASAKFIAALEEMSRQHTLGWIDEKIPVSDFSGNYAGAADLVNTLVRAHIDVKMKIVKLVTTYAHGDFSEAMDRLPGKKAMITEAMDQVRALLPRPSDIADMKRLKAALNNVSANVMIADASNVICYMNPAVSAMMSNAERDLQKDLPNLRVDKLLGTNIDELLRSPAHQGRLLADLRGTHRDEIVIGSRTFGLIANPIIDEQGERIGAVVEWKDRTLEVSVELETAAIVAAAAAGDFGKRLVTEGKEGFFRQLAQSMNSLLETCDVGLNEVVRVLAALSKSDLTETISGDYAGTFAQLKDDSNATVESLTRTVIDIKEAAEIVSTSAREISAGNTDLSQRTEEQASSLEETAASMEELTATVRQNAENAKQANQLAIGASDIAVKGGVVVGEVVETMAAINGSAKKIVDIISVIDGIAFQTNILALNAAVEAARAGEQGRGFAVVAGEVRTLAQRSAAAAKEIKSLIGDSVEKTTMGSKLVDQAGQTMAEIVASVQRVTAIMSAIASASEEQGTGIEQVNQAVAQMDKVTQQNAALVEQVAASAESLEERAQALVGHVSVFRLAGGLPAAGRNATPHRPPARPVGSPKAAAKVVTKRVAPVGAPRSAPTAPSNEESDWSSF